jgi:hypothetical protein
LKKGVEKPLRKCSSGAFLGAGVSANEGEPEQLPPPPPKK